MDQDAAIVGLAPVQQQQPQDQQQEQESQCVQEGEVCKVASDCCSEFCRAFPDVTYRKCTGMLSGHEQHPRQNQNGKEDTDAFKRGGAGGAKHVREREPPALTANEGF